MRLSVILLLVIFFKANATGFAQKITLDKKQVQLQSVLLDISQQSGYRLLFKQQMMENTRPVSITVKNADLETVLKQCFNNQPVSYTLTKNTIVVTESANKAVADRVIKGSVTDEKGSPLPGVNVMVKNTSIGTTTNPNGNFTIKVSSAQAILVFSFVGFENQEIPIGTQTEINVVLRDKMHGLDEVVVVGYATQKKESVTGSISTVSTKELVQSPVADLTNALAGRLPGLTTIQNTGKPGSDASALYIRGIGTYTGQTSPLIMVDGVVRDNFNDIDANEVATISILKDASATAVYGVRGANGVILVTTKRGKEGTPKITASAQTALSTFSQMPNFVNSFQYASLINEQSFENYWVQHSRDADVATWDDFVKKRDANWVKEAVNYYTPDDLLYYQNAHTPTLANGQQNPYYDPYFHPDVDWKKQIFKNYGKQSQYNANINGGTKSVKYFVSLGYLDQGGMFNTDYMPFSEEMDFRKKRYNLRGNMDFDINKNFRISVDLGTQYVTITGMDNDASTWEKRILWSTPLSSPGLINGKFVVPFANQNNQLNPLFSIVSQNSYNINNNSTLNSSIRLSHKLDFITKGLGVNVRGAYDSYFANRSYGTSFPLWYGIRANPNGDKLNPILVQLNEDQPSVRYADFYIDKWRKAYGEFALNYSRSFGKHDVTGLILYNAEKRFDPNLRPDLPHAYLGMAGRITYAYANRYLAELNVGYNGSENFPEGKRFGFLPAYSLGWIISNESFFPKNETFTFLKIRGSLGKVGNDNIYTPGTSTVARYLYLPDTWSYGTGYANGYFFGTLNDRNYVQGASESVLGNPNVTWETATKSNIGVEAKFLDDRLSIVYDHFNEHRVNILSYRGTVPDIVQATLPPYNLGEVKNWGDEFEITYNSKPSKFTYWVKANASTNKNMIVFRDEAIVPGLEYQASTGHPIGQGLYLQDRGLYNTWADLYAVDGKGNPVLSSPVRALNKNGQPYNNTAGQPVYQRDLGYSGAAVQPGEIRLVDVNEDGQINEKDFVRTGKTSIPELTFGFSLGFSYKGFDFSALLQGVGGVAKYSMSQLHFNKLQSIFEVDANRYTPERYAAGERIDFPIAAYNQAGAYNTYFLKSTSYCKLRNMEVGYTFKKDLLQKLGLSSARIYVNGYNLYTWSANKIWGDPENLGFGGYPLTRVYNIGFNVNF